MKNKHLKLLLHISGMFFTVFFTQLFAQADTLSGNTNSQVKVNPGPLSLKPDQAILFDEIILSGKDQQHSEKSASKIIISDLRGSENKGWVLKVKKEDPNENGFGAKSNKGIDISLSPKTTLGYVTVNTEFIVNSKDQEVAKVPDNKITDREIDTPINLNAKLDISKKAVAKEYKTALVWNLTAGPM